MKLGKKTTRLFNTIEAYRDCVCVCPTAICGCTCSSNSQFVAPHNTSQLDVTVPTVNDNIAGMRF